MFALCAIVLIGFCGCVQSFVYDPKNSYIFNSTGYFGYSVFLEFVDSSRFQLLSAAPKDNVIRVCSIKGCQPYNIPQQPSKINFLGAVISGTGDANRGTVICNPQYANAFYHTNGVCYFKQRTFQEYSPLNQPSRQVGRYNRTLEFLYTHGQLGFSVKYVENDGYLFGAPGVLSWKGTIRKYSFDGDDAELNPETKTDKLSYLGYSLEHGYFNFRGRMIECVVAGAPKGAKVFGQVFVFTYLNFPNHLLKIFNGNQFGGYFGHSLMVSSNDLFISAPMYNVKVYDEGCVFIFYGSIPNLQQSQKICGQKSGGRFGFAMTNLGTIGYDLSNVVVISAPYEEENSGAIYLFTKIDDTYQILQKISGKSVLENIRGFGFSLSNSLDIDRNYYRDFAVGGYLSSTVVIFKSRPILHFTGFLKSNISRIQDDVNELDLEYCFQYRGYNSSGVVNIQYDIIADDRVENQNLNNVLNVKMNQFTCEKINLKLRQHAHYNPYPLNIKIWNKLEDCVSCAVVYPNDTSVEIEISSATGCGNDGICTPHLKMYHSLINMSSFVVGSQPSLPLIVEVRNMGETAYHCKVNLTLSAEISQIPAACSRHENVIICDVSNRFGSQQTKSLRFDVDMKNYYNYSSQITGDVRAFSVGEGDGTMAYQKINLLLVYKSNLTIVGYSSPENLMCSDKDLCSLHHEYVLFNNGPSPFINQFITFMVPQNISDSDGNLRNIFNVYSTAENLCSSDDAVNTVKTKRNIQEINDVNTTNDRPKISLDCNDVNAMLQCKKYVCDVELLVNQSVKIGFGVKVNFTELIKSYRGIIKEKDVMIFESLMQYNESSLKVHTVLYQPATKKPVAIWIWVVSVILAILILTLIIYALYKQ